MGFLNINSFRNLGKGLGTVARTVIGGSTKLIEKAIGKKWSGAGELLEKIGDGVKESSKVRLEATGQFVDGVAKTTYRVIKKEENHKADGVAYLKDSTIKTLKGVGNTLKQVASSTGTVAQGVASRNHQKTIEGLKDIGKVAAIAALSTGIADASDKAKLQSVGIFFIPH